MVQSMRHPELFGAVASHSGDIYFEFGYLPDMAKLHANLMRFGGLEGFIEQIPTIKPKSHDPFFSVLGHARATAQFARPTRTRRAVSAMPIDMDTGRCATTWQRWLAWDPVRMIDQPENIAAWRQMSYIYIDCGLWDELNFQIGTRASARKSSMRWVSPTTSSCSTTGNNTDALPRDGRRRA
ncbi:MAG: hypothetical protein U0703_02275 [Anaerolineae bacterium]